MTIEQRGAGWLKSATPDQISAAFHAGELNDYMNEAPDGTNLDGRPKQPQTDQGMATALGLTLAEFQHIESPESQAKIIARLNETQEEAAARVAALLPSPKPLT